MTKEKEMNYNVKLMGLELTVKGKTSVKQMVRSLGTWLTRIGSDGFVKSLCTIIVGATLVEATRWGVSCWLKHWWQVPCRKVNTWVGGSTPQLQPFWIRIIGISRIRRCQSCRHSPSGSAVPSLQSDPLTGRKMSANYG